MLQKQKLFFLKPKNTQLDTQITWKTIVYHYTS